MTQIEKEKLQKRQHLKKFIFRVVNICSYVLALLFIIVLIVSGAKACSKTSNKQVKQVNEISLVQRDVAYLKDDDSLYYNSLGDLLPYINDDFGYFRFPNVSNTYNNAYLDEYSHEEDYFTLYFTDVPVRDGINDTFEGYVDELYISYNAGAFECFFAYNDEDYVFESWLYDNLLIEDDSYYLEISLKYGYILGASYNETYITGRELYNQNVNVNGAFTTLSDSSVSFIESLNNGLTDLFSIFYDDGVTTLGYLVLIVVGVSLCWVTFRLISALIRIRG